MTTLRLTENVWFKKLLLDALLRGSPLRNGLFLGYECNSPILCPCYVDTYF